jgi:hypothetical protein
MPYKAILAWLSSYEITPIIFATFHQISKTSSDLSLDIHQIF